VAAGTPRREQEMRAHLPGCAVCHDVYERFLAFAEVDPAAVPAIDRLAHGIGLPPLARRRRPLRRRAPWGVAALLGVAAVAAALVVVPRPRPRAPQPEMGGFVPRGLAVAHAPELLVYRIAGPGSVPEPAADTVRAGDELAFAYRNPGRKRHLMVFAVDEHGHVFWYHPEWSRAEDNPAAVSISTDSGLRELPAAVAQRLDGEELTMHALFTDRELTVRDVEVALATAGTAAGNTRAPPFPDADDVVHRFKVVR
jgi:hypothetical protein